MSVTYDWPAGIAVAGFSLRLRRNTRTFTSPYSGTTQTVELGGERWVAEVTTAPTDRRSTASLQREALADKLAGGVNRVRLWHFFNPTAGGTFRASTPTLRDAVAAGASTCNLTVAPGATITEGSMLSINGQLVRVMANATASGAGVLAVAFAPRARFAWPATTSPIVTDKATAAFKLGGDVPTPWSAGLVAGNTFDLIEDIN